VLLWYAHVCNVNYVIKYLWLPSCRCTFVHILYMFNLSYLYLIFTYFSPQGKFCMKGEIFQLNIIFYETWLPWQSWHIKSNISTQNRRKDLTPKPCILWIQETHYATYVFFTHKEIKVGSVANCKRCCSWMCHLGAWIWWFPTSKAHGIASRGSRAWVFALSIWIYELRDQGG
jgi:hypothetical protein